MNDFAVLEPELLLAPHGDADQDGPGDHIDLLAHFDAADPATITSDHVDHTPDERHGKLTALAASSSRPNYRLSDKHRHEINAVMLKGIEWMLEHPASVHYTQDAVLRWSAIHDGLRIIKGQYLTHGDCSSTTSWLLKNGLYRAGFHPDVVNFDHWLGGYTGTEIAHGRRVVHDENLRFGDLIFYGDQGGGVPEHVAMYVGGGMVFSHGSEGGPYKLPIDYRSDRRKGEARRYY